MRPAKLSIRSAVTVPELAKQGQISHKIFVFYTNKHVGYVMWAYLGLNGAVISYLQYDKDLTTATT